VFVINTSINHNIFIHNIMSLAATLRKTASKVGTFANNMVPSGSSFDTLNNKWILYFILFVSIVDLFNFFKIGDITAIAIFIIVGFLTTYFSKNMLVILVISIAVTHIARYGNASLEGMEGEADEEEEEKVDEGMTGEEEEEEVDEGMEGEAPGEAQGEEEEEEGLQNPEPALSKITKSLDTIKKVHPDEIAGQTQTLIDQTKKVQENMAMLEPYLKQAADATKPLQAEGFCDYASAYKK
jgi:hypothetical protein